MASKFIGTGLYSIPEAARYTDSKSNTLRHWFGGGGSALLRSDYAKTSIPHAISFLDLIEAYVVSDFRKMGLSLQHIRKVHSLYRTTRGESHPFARKGFLVDIRKNRLVEEIIKAGGSQFLVDALQNQGEFVEVIGEDLREVQYNPDTRLAETWRIADGILIDPNVRFGKPVIAGTRLTTRVISDQYNAYGQNADEVAEIYGIRREEVIAAVDFEDSKGTATRAA